MPLAEHWFGRVNSWGLQSAPEPEGAIGAEFWGVSCPSGPVCFAFGDSSANETPCRFPPSARLLFDALGFELTKLKPEQAAYIGVPVEGPYKSDHYRC